MIGQSVVFKNDERIKKLAEVKLDAQISIEELQAIRQILINAGLLVKIEGRELMILSIERSDND